jgi:hypothetical protein
MGSGHFLVAAAHRIAHRLAVVRTGDDEPSPEATRTALRDVIGRCIYGVDVNPMAVELCKVSLWMEALDPGRPLSFLEAHIKCGNSLLGTTAALMAEGIPDAAFKALEGDAKETSKSLRIQNKGEREGQLTLEDATFDLVGALESRATAVESADDATVDSLRIKERLFHELVASAEFERAKLTADAWCAAFVQRKEPAAPRITTGVVRRIASGGVVPGEILAEVSELVVTYRFFHWQVEFPQVFGHEGAGFDLVLGNPPWERVKLQEKEFFAGTHPEIASAGNKAQRTQLIQQLAVDDPTSYGAFRTALRRAEGEGHLVRNSGQYPLCGRGDVNTYSIFAEAMRSLIAPTGRVGCIVPSGIATDDTTQLFFGDLVTSRSLVSLLEFENEGFFAGAGQGHMLRFCLLTLLGTAGSVAEIELMFRGQDVAELADPERRFTLLPEDFALLNPNTHTCPIFRTRRDADITKAIYRRVPVLVDESRGEAGNSWGVKFVAMFHMSNDSHLFRTREQLEAEGYGLAGNVFSNGVEQYLPLYEAKMVNQFNHRYADYRQAPQGERPHRLPETSAERLADPAALPLPFYWVLAKDVNDAAPATAGFLGWREITDSRASARTLVATVLPRCGVGNKFLLIDVASARDASVLLAALNGFVLDFVARQKLGGISLSYFVLRQLPIPAPSRLLGPAPWAPRQSAVEWINQPVLELLYTAWDLKAFARTLEYHGPPFRLDDARRVLLRTELDAAFFHLYGLAEEDVDYVMETFPIVKRRDEAKHGHYQTKALILDVYRKMADAIATGIPYETILDTPPADSRVAHGYPAPASVSSGGDSVVVPTRTRGSATESECGG